jgi:hypothetical protein
MAGLNERLVNKHQDCELQILWFFPVFFSYLYTWTKPSLDPATSHRFRAINLTQKTAVRTIILLAYHYINVQWEKFMLWRSLRGCLSLTMKLQLNLPIYANTYKWVIGKSNANKRNMDFVMTLYIYPQNLKYYNEKRDYIVWRFFGFRRELQ